MLFVSSKQLGTHELTLIIFSREKSTTKTIRLRKYSPVYSGEIMIFGTLHINR